MDTPYRDMTLPTLFGELRARLHQGLPVDHLLVYAARADPRRYLDVWEPYLEGKGTSTRACLRRGWERLPEALREQLDHDRLGAPPAPEVLDLTRSVRTPEALRARLDERSDRPPEILELSHNPLGEPGCQVLAEHPLAHAVRTLNLSECSIGVIGAQALSRAPFERLDWLDMRDNSLCDEGAAALLTSPHLERVRTLLLERNHLREGVAQALASSRMYELMELSLAGDWRIVHEGWTDVPSPGPEAVEALTRVDHLVWLRRLDLGACLIGAEGAAWMPRVPFLGQLEELNLSFNMLGDEGLEALVQADLSGLIELDLSCNELTGRAASILLDAPSLPSTCRLRLTGNDLDEEVCQALEAAGYVVRTRFMRMRHVRPLPASRGDRIVHE